MLGLLLLLVSVSRKSLRDCRPPLSRRWEDPESPESIAEFRAMVGRLGERTLAVGPLDGRNGSDSVYAVGNKAVWKSHLRRSRAKRTESPEVDAMLVQMHNNKR